jgi:transcriptional regulator with XRE-family HTH domain
MLSVADQTKSLLQNTRALLEKRRSLTLREIATAAGVELEWLRKLHYGHIRSPNIERVERVHKYLTDYNTAQRFEQSRQKKLTTEARP